VNRTQEIQCLYYRSRRRKTARTLGERLVKSHNIGVRLAGGQQSVCQRSARSHHHPKENAGIGILPSFQRNQREKARPSESWQLNVLQSNPGSMVKIGFEHEDSETPIVNQHRPRTSVRGAPKV
jgi:hypothetical protein